MKAQIQFSLFLQYTSRRSFLGAAVFLICVLLTHSLDNCAAHLGGLTRSSQGTLQALAACPNGLGACQLCAPTQPSPPDGCDLLSETAVLNSSHHSVERPVVTLTAMVATIPTTQQTVMLSGCLHGLAGPPPVVPAAVFLRSTLPARAPPVLA